MPTKPLTIAAVRATLHPLGLRITHHNGEYTVNFTASAGGSKLSTYHANDLADARDTGLAMHRRRITAVPLRDAPAVRVVEVVATDTRQSSTTVMLGDISIADARGSSSCGMRCNRRNYTSSVVTYPHAPERIYSVTVRQNDVQTSVTNMCGTHLAQMARALRTFMQENHLEGV